MSVSIYIMDKGFKKAKYLVENKKVLKFVDSKAACSYLQTKIRFRDEKHLEDFGIYFKHENN